MQNGTCQKFQYPYEISHPAKKVNIFIISSTFQKLDVEKITLIYNNIRISTEDELTLSPIRTIHIIAKQKYLKATKHRYSNCIPCRL